MNFKVKFLIISLIFILGIGLLVGCSESKEMSSETFKLTTKTVEGEGTIKKTPNKKEYVKGTEVELKAVPDSNYEFKNWTGNLEGKEQEKTITITEDVTIGAEFSKVELSDKTKIKNQMEQWTAAWETNDTSKLKETMVSKGIRFITENLDKKDLTIDQFIEFITSVPLWEGSTSSSITIDSIKISDNTATLIGELKIGSDFGGYKIPTTVNFIKDNKWLITEMEWGKTSQYYEGEENEEFDPERHDAYVSFKADGELYTFHDHYGAHDHEMSKICTYNNCFSIDVYDYKTEERFILDFTWEGKDAGEFTGVTWRPTGDWDSAFEEPASDFTATMDTYNLSEGLVKGTFSGEIANEAGQIVDITEGFFYIEHEFNLPEITINQPTDGAEVSGDVTISGTAEDDSELIDVNVSVIENFGTDPEDVIDREEAEGTNDWSFTFDSTQYTDGEYKVEVFARDKHYNYSVVETITIDIANN